MPNPTRQEIVNAHEALEYLVKNLYDIPLEEAKHTDSYERLAKFLPPKPLPTMADVEWDDNKHFLAEAELKGYGPVIMLWEATQEYISVIREGRVWPAYNEDLTPTGKRYTLTEV